MDEMKGNPTTEEKDPCSMEQMPYFPMTPLTSLQAEALLSQKKGCKEIGPLKICWEELAEGLKVTFYLLGSEVGSHIFSQTKQQCAELNFYECMGFSFHVGIAKARLKICFDFKKRIISVEGETCLWVIYRWKCIGINWKIYL